MERRGGIVAALLAFPAIYNACNDKDQKARKPQTFALLRRQA